MSEAGTLKAIKSGRVFEIVDGKVVYLDAKTPRHVRLFKAFCKRSAHMLVFVAAFYLGRAAIIYLWG